MNVHSRRRRGGQERWSGALVATLVPRWTGGRHGYLYDIVLAGETIVANSHDPGNDACRVLFNRGKTGKLTLIDETGRPRMSFDILRAAFLTVSEESLRGLRLRRDKKAAASGDNPEREAGTLPTAADIGGGPNDAHARGIRHWERDDDYRMSSAASAGTGASSVAATTSSGSSSAAPAEPGAAGATAAAEPAFSRCSADVVSIRQRWTASPTSMRKAGAPTRRPINGTDPPGRRPRVPHRAITNTAVGYLLALVVQLVAFPMFGLNVSFTDNLAIALLFTAVSIVRSYTLRRLFERLRRPVPVPWRTSECD